MEKKRFYLIDEYRGFCMINMILYHAIWDLVYIFGCNWQWYKSELTFYWQQSVCWSFIFVPESRVIFGVLTLLGSSMLLMIPCDKLFSKVNPWIGAIISFVTFLFVYPVNDGYFGFGGKEMVSLPMELYSDWISTYIGFPMPGFWSTDYFSILPWFFLYATGYFCYSILFRGKEGNGKTMVKEMISKSICSPLGWIGRNALIIYMLHQPIVYGILIVWNMIR